MGFALLLTLEHHKGKQGGSDKEDDKDDRNNEHGDHATIRVRGRLGRCLGHE